MENYRLLTPQEINILKSRNCTADSWHKILVDDFDPERYYNVNFSGNIKLGTARGMLTNSAGLKRPCGIYNASIHNCEIGPHVRISSVDGSISNYKIGEGSFISVIGSICCHKNAMFGNGTYADVMDETGGRSIRIYDCMTAQTAYMAALYRHRPDFIEALDKMTDVYINSRKSDNGRIGKNVIIENCPSISDVIINDEAVLTNVSVLTNGTVGRRAKVANSVIAENFIISSQASITNGSMLQNAFIGQASIIANGFTATHSLIFANCNLQCGEACSIIAGPHTASHHKSTLLIGGIFSFFNAGSATNQSNHMYRLGPMHQGIMERGCKTGSNSYVLWPADFGQFSIILGSHYSHPDTSMFPYSTIVAREGKTFVMPGATVCTSGLIRDLLKWPKRDNRHDDIENLDIINYDIISPLNVSKMYRGLEYLAKYDSDPDALEKYNFTLINKTIASGRENYAFAIDFFMGKYLTNLVNETTLEQNIPIGRQLFPKELPDNEKWIDILGLLAPRNIIRDQIIKPTISGNISSLQELQEKFFEIGNNYNNLVTDFLHQNFKKIYSITTDELTPQNLITILERWCETVAAMKSKRLADGLKEFDPNMRIGFSPDDINYRDADFEAVRGTPQNHPQLNAIHEHYTSYINNCYHAMDKLKDLLA